MKKLLLAVIVLIMGCNNYNSVQDLAVRKGQIDQIINSQDRFAKVCHQDSSFQKMATGKIDTAIRTFFCDSVGKIYLLKTTFSYPRSKPEYWIYFSQGSIIKVVMSYVRQRDEYYIEQDTILGTKVNYDNVDFLFVSQWISRSKNDYNQFDSIKRNK